ncbi:MAG: radical SAM protein [Patescibacteria group bacterium]
MISKVLKTALVSSLFGWQQPKHLIFHVTSRCNARCGMCFVWKRLNKNKDLTLEEIEKIAKILPGLIFLDISGGEPFLRDDLTQILAIFEKESPGVYVNLPTNGLMPERIEKETRKILRETDLSISLNLSLDGLEKTHDEIRGVKGNFEKVLQTYRRLAQVKKENPRLSLKVATVVSKLNFHELEGLADFVKREMKEIDFQTLILVRGEPADKSFTLPPLEELKKQQSTFFEIWQNYGYGKNLGWFGSKVANSSHRFLFHLYLKTLKEKKMSLPCLAGNAHVVVFANGDLSFCELRQPIGNLRKVNFNFWSLWQGKEAQKQRQEIAQNACFCTHGCNWTDNIFFSLKTYPFLVRELIRSFC